MYKNTDIETYFYLQLELFLEFNLINEDYTIKLSNPISSLKEKTNIKRES